MQLTAAEIHHVSLPLVAPFRTSFGVQDRKEALLIRVICDDGTDGWGECVALEHPTYSGEYTLGARDVIERYLLPKVLVLSELNAAEVAPALRIFHGHPMAKAAVEMAVLDCELKRAGTPLAQRLGATRARVPAGVSVGIMSNVKALLQAVEAYLDEGYRRIKLKIEPGWDVTAVRAVRETFGAEVLLQVDANTAYRREDASHLRNLDEFGLLLIEQPLAEDDLVGHAHLAAVLETPVCLDESITSAKDLAFAISLGACEVVNIKPGRVGGYLEARSAAAVAQAHGVPAWCGGMLETGLGRGANAALAACPEFTLPGDISASGRFYAVDITEPFVLSDGYIEVPSMPGVSRPLDLDALASVTVSVTTVG